MKLKFNIKKNMIYDKYLEVRDILKNNPKMDVIKWNIAPLEINPHRITLTIDLELRKRNE